MSDSDAQLVAALLIAMITDESGGMRVECDAMQEARCKRQEYPCVSGRR